MNIDGMNVTFYYEPPMFEPMKEDVVGVGKEFLEDIIASITQAKLFEAVGVQPDKTYLLEGEPGTGKTFSVKALNNTLNKPFLDELIAYQQFAHENPEAKLPPPMPLAYVFPYDVGKYGTAYINRGSRVVQAFFDMVYASSTRLPTIVVLDEADALLTSRKNMLHATKEDYKVLETLMKNLQEAHDTPNTYVVMMTNYKDVMDEAVLRAGRIDKKYTFNLPNYEARKTLFQNTIEKMNERAGYQVVRKYDLDRFAEMSEGFNGADIVSVTERALKRRVEEVAKTKTDKIIPALYITGSRVEDEISYHQINFKEQKKPLIGFAR